MKCIAEFDGEQNIYKALSRQLAEYMSINSNACNSHYLTINSCSGSIILLLFRDPFVYLSIQLVAAPCSLEQIERAASIATVLPASWFSSNRVEEFS